MIRIVVKYKYQIIIATIFLGLILGILIGNFLTDYIDQKRAENYYSIDDTLVSILSYIGWIIWFIPAILLTWIVIKFIIFPSEKKLDKKQDLKD